MATEKFGQQELIKNSELLNQSAKPAYHNPMLTPIIFMKHHPEQMADPSRQFAVMDGTLGSGAGSHQTLPNLPQV